MWDSHISIKDFLFATMAEHVDSEERLAQFLQEGQKQNAPVFIKFTAKWCGPCRQIAPKFDALAKAHADKAYFVSVDIDHLQDVATTFKVRQIPCFVAVKDMKPVESWLGANPVILEQKIAHHIAK